MCLGWGDYVEIDTPSIMRRVDEGLRPFRVASLATLPMSDLGLLSGVEFERVRRCRFCYCMRTHGWVF